MEQIGALEVNRRMLPQFQADVRIYHNVPGSREPTQQGYVLELREGITVIPQEMYTEVRLPILGLRAITRNDLKPIIDGKRRHITLKTEAWF